MPTWQAYAYATGVVLSSVVYTLTIHPYFFGVQHTGMRIRIAACSLIYKKVNSNAQNINDGMFLYSDFLLTCSRVSSWVRKLWVKQQLAKWWICSRMTSTVLTHLLYSSIISGSALCKSLSVWLLSFSSLGLHVWQDFPFWSSSCPYKVEYLHFEEVLFKNVLTSIRYSGWMGKVFSRLRMKTAICTDERIRTMNEIISGMRVIKMYAWEKPFAKLIEYCRKYQRIRILMKNWITEHIFWQIIGRKFKSCGKLTTFVPSIWVCIISHQKSPFSWLFLCTSSQGMRWHLKKYYIILINPKFNKKHNVIFPTLRNYQQNKPITNKKQILLFTGFRNDVTF